MKIIYLTISLLLLNACSGNFDSGEYIEMSAEDCVEGEQYDPVEKVCFYECDTDEECEAIQAKIDAQLAKIYEAGEDYKGADEKVVEAIQLNGEGLIASYKIEGDQIIEVKNQEVPEDLKSFQLDKDKHQAIWNYFIQMIPSENREDFAEFQIFTDGKDNALAAVAPLDEEPSKWMLLVDITDAYEGGVMDETDLSYSLIHEFGHVLTLNASQVNPIPMMDDDMEKRMKECQPHYGLQEGCSLASSYINQFFNQFWLKIHEEWRGIQTIESDDDFYEKMDDFYQTHQSKFISDYAVTNPEEDIAESWAYFILKPRPTRQTLADKKVNFFYEFPELVRLKKVINQRLIK